MRAYIILVDIIYGRLMGNIWPKFLGQHLDIGTDVRLFGCFIMGMGFIKRLSDALDHFGKCR